MLQRLAIDKFKSIERADLRFGRANLFIGPNGAGKSNVLEALGVVAAALSRGIDQESLDSRGVRLSLPRIFKSSFKNRRLPKAFHLTAYFENGRYSCSIRAGVKSPFLEFTTEALYEGNKQIFGRGPRGARVYETTSQQEFDYSRADSTRSLWDAASPVIQVTDKFRAELESFSQFRVYAPQTAVMRGIATDIRAIEPLGLTGSGLAQAFSDVLRLRYGASTERAEKDRLQEIIDVIWQPGWADQVKVGSFDPDIVPPQVRSEGVLLYIRDKYMNSNRNLVSPYDASEGTLYLIFVATLLAHPRAPRPFALDNVDGTLNPKLVRKLTSHIANVCGGPEEEKGAPPHAGHQAFLTSHHPSALDSFDIFNHHHSLFTVNRSQQADSLGATSFFKVVPPEGMTKSAWTITHGGANLSRLLLDGRIPGALE